MMRLAIIAVAAALLLPGCLFVPVEPGASTGTWTTATTDPFFARVGYAGMCHSPVMPCQHATVLYEDAKVLWFSFGPHANDAGEPSPYQSPDARYDATLRAALDRLGEKTATTKVWALRTATLNEDDHGHIRDQLRKELTRAEDPGPVSYDCTDYGSPRLVSFGTPAWDVNVEARDGHCGHNENPQEAWYRIRDQADALQRWVAPEPWTQARGVLA